MIFDRDVWTVYKTTNNAHKRKRCYVGVHRIDAGQSIHDDYLGSGIWLQRAVDKYGSDNFSKQILAVFSDWRRAYSLEKRIVTPEWVESDDNYNLVGGGRGVGYMSEKARKYLSELNSQPFIYEGKEFRNLKECADYYGVTLQAVHLWVFAKRVRGGRPTKEDYKRAAEKRKVPVLLEGKTYSCAQDAADYYGVNVKTIRNWLKAGRIFDPESRKKPFPLRGRQFSCLKEAADYFNVHVVTIQNWQKLEKNPELAYVKPPYIFNGEKFANRREAAEKYNVTERTIVDWQKHPERFKKHIGKGEGFDMGGINFQNNKEAAKYFQVKEWKIYDWKNNPEKLEAWLQKSR